METTFKKIMMILLAVSSLAACSNKNDNRTTRDPGLNVGTAGAPTTCDANQQAVGRIYDAGTAGTVYSFEQRVKGLISASVDPEEFGIISSNSNVAQNGVTIEGHLFYDGNGNVLLDQSKLKITVSDSFVGQKNSDGKIIEAYPINFNSAVAGTMNLQTKAFMLQFKDAYGDITLNGVINAATVTGTVSYQNYTSYDGGQASAGVLGTFSIATCGWVN
jgi:hypothetical protein